MKNIAEHCISIDMTQIEDDFFLKLIIRGSLTHEDYEEIIPLIEDLLAGIKEPKIKVLVDAREFDGWELRAALDDLKFGLKHNKEFTKLAFVGNKKWEEYSIKVSNWFMSGEMKYFEDIDSAANWLNKKDKEIKEMNTVEKEFSNRKEEILKELKSLFESNIRITDWDVPEVDDKEAANILINILQEGIDTIKKDIESGSFIR